MQSDRQYQEYRSSSLVSGCGASPRCRVSPCRYSTTMRSLPAVLLIASSSPCITLSFLQGYLAPSTFHPRLIASTLSLNSAPAALDPIGAEKFLFLLNGGISSKSGQLIHPDIPRMTCRLSAIEDSQAVTLPVPLTDACLVGGPHDHGLNPKLIHIIRNPRWNRL